VPFDPVSKRTEALVFNKKTNEKLRVAKGAPQVILAMCQNYNLIEKQVTDKVNSYAQRGFRTIGVCSAIAGADEKTCIPEGEKNPLPEGEVSSVKWQFVGLIPLRDECRPRMREIIRKAFELGVTVKMITGDQTAIARETCRELDMGSLIYNADILNPDSETAKQLNVGEQMEDVVEKGNGFAEVFPEHKYQIVEILKKNGHRVGMTGDGVNDAPALKVADIGIAVADATD